MTYYPYQWFAFSSDRAEKRGVELKQAYNQIQRYYKTSFHGLFDYIQLFVISNGVKTRYFANNPNSGYNLLSIGLMQLILHSTNWISLQHSSLISVLSAN
jgi:type I site-specific restriction-modification system R (restriction) subunit